MSSTMDPAKLKVVELRAELSKRGLDSKGNKPALVKRLKEALEEELKQDLPDTSIGDTSTEDLDNSQATEQSITEEANVPDKEHEKTDPQCAASQQEHNTNAEVTETADNTGEKMEIEEAPPLEAVTKEPEPEPEPEQKSDAQPEPESELEETQELKIVDQSEEKEMNSNMEENKENGEQDEPKSRKSRWGTEVDSLEATEEEIQCSQAESVDVPKVDKDAEPKGEKRRRSSPSPDRSQRRRSKSPIKEDEPPIDNDKVQLSWYDSDLHLQLDKESFLSAKPYHEGAFGYAWAGVRATHGVSAGKVCFEVKITEELKWEDLSKYYDKHRRDQYKSFSKHKTDDDKKKSEEELKNKGDDHKNENIPPENGENSENAPEDVPEVKKTAENEAVDECKREHVETPKIEESEKEMMETDEPEKQVEADENKSQTEPDENKSQTEPDENKSQTEPDESKKQIGEDEIGKQTEINEAKMQTENQEELTNKELGEPIPTHLFRVGWSLLDTGLQLGEDKYSYGYESSGRFVINKQFQNYGIQFGVGDVVASFLNITESGISISYSVNGVSQSEAVSIPLTDVPENFALFPHVLSRNCAFQLNLGSQEESWFAKPEEFNDYEFLDKVESKIAGPARPENRNDCEVILMCGLPAAGKTHWVREYVQSNPDKKYTLLGNTHLLEKMTVSGDALKTKFKGSWNILLDKLQKCLNKLIEIAALRRRNYIIDQTNVFPSAQRRKLRPFEGFKRRAVVVVVGEEEQAKRQSLQEAQDGKDVPDSSVLEMKANMSLPQKGDWIDEVVYAGVPEEEAKALVQKYNAQGREAGYGVQRRFGHRDDRHRWQNRRNDYRGGNYRDRNYHNNRYDRGPPRQGSWNPPRPGGWNRDRRDNRGPPMGGPRDWRNRGNSRDRGSRDSHGQGNNYNRNRNQPGRGPGGNWPSGSWGQNQANWGNQPWGGQGSWGQGGWGSQSSQNQWKYGGGSQGYGNYSNWNYYGQYPQNWGGQGQTHSVGNASGSNANQYGQYSQQEWAQYAQQYAQQGQNTTGSAITQSTPQK